MWADDPTNVTINFGTTSGYWAAHTNDANQSYSTYTDSDSRQWTRVCSVSNMSGQAGYSQFGNTDNTPTVTFTATAGSDMTVTAFSVTMNGASGGNKPSAGTIYLYKRTALGAETQLATASVSGTSSVTCQISSSQSFSSTDILKVYYVGTTKAIRVTQLSYSYITGGDPIPSVSLDTYTINAPNTAVSTTSIGVTYENLTNYDTDVIFYESDGTTAATYDHSWITAEINATTKNLDYSIAANTGAARTAYFKVYALGEGDAEAYSSLVTVTQAKAIVNYTYNLASAVIPGRHYIIASGKNGSVKAMGKQNGNYRDVVGVSASNGSITVSNDAGVYEVLIQANEAKGYYTLYDVENEKYLYANSNSSNNINIEAELDKNDNGIWSIEIDENNVATIKAQGSNSRNWLRYNSSDTRFSCYGANNTQADVYLYEKAGDTGHQEVSVTIAEACTDGEKYYGTYSSPFGFIIPDGLTVEEIGIDNEGKLDVQAYAAGVRVPANTGVLISSSTFGSKTLTLAGGGTSVKGENNRLRATHIGITAEAMATAAPSCKYYRLTMHNGTQIGFWWGAAGGAAFALGANKAYLAVPTGAGAPSLLWFDNGSTGVNTLNVERETLNGEYYNLAGQRVANPTKGLYIVNGKKVVIK